MGSSAKVVAVVNHKGGVGKTTTTHNLGAALRTRGLKVLLVDIDPQSNLTQAHGLQEPRPNMAEWMNGEPLPSEYEPLHLLPSALDLLDTERQLEAEGVAGYTVLAEMLEPALQYYDLVMIDCPPDLGILTQNALMAATGALVVVQPQYFSLNGLETILTLLKKVRRLNPQLDLTGILVSMADRTQLTSKITAYYDQNWPDRVFSTSIRRAVAVAEAQLAGQSILEYAPEAPVSADYRALSNEFLERLDYGQEEQSA